MATAIQGRISAERRFYSWMAIAMIAFVLIGFAPSFYLKGLVHYPRPNPTLSPLVLLHGALFTTWMLVFWAQTALIAAGRREVHMQLGKLGMGLAVLMVPMMYAVAVGQVSRANQPPFTTPLGWTAVPLSSIPAFAILVWQGWARRKDAQSHKRLMLSAALLMMAPAVGRFPIAPPVYAGAVALHVLAWLCFTPLVWWDLRTLGRIHWATKLGVGLTGLFVLTSSVLLAMPGWEKVAAQLPGV